MQKRQRLGTSTFKDEVKLSLTPNYKIQQLFSANNSITIARETYAAVMTGNPLKTERQRERESQERIVE
jgi:hypothetical protein